MFKMIVFFFSVCFTCGLLAGTGDFFLIPFYSQKRRWTRSFLTLCKFTLGTSALCLIFVALSLIGNWASR